MKLFEFGLLDDEWTDLYGCVDIRIYRKDRGYKLVAHVTDYFLEGFGSGVSLREDQLKERPS